MGKCWADLLTNNMSIEYKIGRYSFIPLHLNLPFLSLSPLTAFHKPIAYTHTHIPRAYRESIIHNKNVCTKRTTTQLPPQYIPPLLPSLPPPLHKNNGLPDPNHLRHRLLSPRIIRRTLRPRQPHGVRQLILPVSAYPLSCSLHPPPPSHFHSLPSFPLPLSRITTHHDTQASKEASNR